MTREKIRYGFLALLPLVIVLVNFPSNARADFFKLGDGWLDYGNGAINLSNVGTVRPYVTYKLTLASDEEYSSDDLGFISYTPSWSNLRDEGLDNFFSFFDELGDEPFYFIELTMGIYFDAFDLVYDEFSFLYVPNPTVQEDLERLQQIENEGLVEKFEEFLMLTKLEFSDEMDFDLELTDEDFMEIVSNVNLPTENSIKEIQTAFGELEKSYLDIVN